MAHVQGRGRQQLAETCVPSVCTVIENAMVSIAAGTRFIWLITLFDALFNALFTAGVQLAVVASLRDQLGSDSNYLTSLHQRLTSYGGGSIGVRLPLFNFASSASHKLWRC